jgi:hypothetical protein
VLLIVLVALLALLGIGALLTGPIVGSGSSGRSAATVDVRLEPRSSAGANPFLAPVGTDQALSVPTMAGGKFSGDTPGLYAIHIGQPSCDAQEMLAELRADPRRMSAWSDALGISSADVPAFIGTLSPVLLRSDTAVTSYSYADGRSTARQSVLQTGTAVFMDGYGEPAVKCFNGDPLGEPTIGPQPNYVSAPWPGFHSCGVTVIEPTGTSIKSYTLIEARSGDWVHRPGKTGWPREPQTRQS